MDRDGLQIVRVVFCVCVCVSPIATELHISTASSLSRHRCFCYQMPRAAIIYNIASLLLHFAVNKLPTSDEWEWVSCNYRAVARYNTVSVFGWRGGGEKETRAGSFLAVGPGWRFIPASLRVSDQNHPPRRYQAKLIWNSFQLSNITDKPTRYNTFIQS